MKEHDFYITGESYAGIYIPLLAEQIIDFNNAPTTSSSERIKLKGIMVGNGVASWEYDTAPAMTDFAFTHHLYSYETRLQYNKVCVDNYDKDQCDAVNEEISTSISGINIYDILQDCGRRKPKDEGVKLKKYTDSYYYKYAKWAFKNPAMKTPSNKTFLSVLFDHIDLTEQNGDVPCIESDNWINYLNRDDVKAALHVKQSIKWDICSDSVSENYNILPKGSWYVYPKLIANKLRIMIYSGDTDMAVPFNGNQRWIDSLKLGVKSPWRRWRAFDDNSNVAGYRTIYNGLTFVTIKGTGHMVPQWKPKEAFYMFTRFLNDEDL